MILINTVKFLPGVPLNVNTNAVPRVLNASNGGNESKVNETLNSDKIFLWLVWFFCIRIYRLYQIQVCARFIFFIINKQGSLIFPRIIMTL